MMYIYTYITLYIRACETLGVQSEIYNVTCLQPGYRFHEKLYRFAKEIYYTSLRIFIYFSKGVIDFFKDLIGSVNVVFLGLSPCRDLEPVYS